MEITSIDLTTLNDDITGVDIYDSSGNIVKQYSGSELGSEISFGNGFNTGFYVAHINTRSGRKVLKLVKQ